MLRIFRALGSLSRRLSGQGSGGRAKASGKKRWAPDRQEVIWIDCDPQVGQEMREVHPFLVLSPRIFNERTSLVIGPPMTTARSNSDNPFAVVAGKAAGRKAGQTGHVLCHQPRSFDWRLRKAKAHPLKALPDAVFAEVCERLNRIVQLG